MKKNRKFLGIQSLLIGTYYVIISTLIEFPNYHNLYADYNIYNAEYAVVYEKCQDSICDIDNTESFIPFIGKIIKIGECEICLLLNNFNQFPTIKKPPIELKCKDRILHLKHQIFKNINDYDNPLSRSPPYKILYII